MRTEQGQLLMDEKKVLQMGRTFMLDAQQSEVESDYIAAEGIYHVCCELFSGLMGQSSPYETDARGEYMHALFRCAMLPQISQQEKLRYLNQACELAAELERETGEMEYTIAVGCMEEELEELNKTLERQIYQKQQDMIQF